MKLIKGVRKLRRKFLLAVVTDILPWLLLSVCLGGSILAWSQISQPSRAGLVLMGGIAASLVCFSLAWTLAVQRERAIKLARQTIANLQESEYRNLHQNEYLVALHETTLSLVKHLQVTDLLEVIITRAGRLVGTPHGVVVLLDRTTNEMVAQVAIGFSRGYLGYRFKPGEGMLGRSWQQGRPLLIEHYQQWEGRLSDGPFKDLQISSSIAVPLTSRDQGQIIGVLSLLHSEPDRGFQADDLQMLERFALLASLALDNARLYSAAQREITVRKQIEQALTESQQYLQDLLDNAQDLIYSTNPEGRFIYVNRAWQKALGYSLAEACNLTVLDVVHPSHHEMCRGLFGRLISGEVLTNIETIFITKTGRTLVVEGHASCRMLAGQSISTRSIFRDVTERKRYEAELALAHQQTLETSRLKSEFVANISHEVRTPLCGILGMAELMCETPLNSEQKEYCQVIYNSALTLQRLINNLLDFSELETDKLALKEAEFNLLKLLDETLQAVMPQARQQNLQLRCNIEQNVPVWCIGDAERLQQILFHLFSNAVKFTEQGEITLTVRLEAETGSHVRLYFAVRDTGIGLSPEAYKRLFQSFSQLDGSITRKYGGTGLGLYISRQLLELMHGEINVESEAGQGSTFWFVIPVTRAAPKLLAEPLDSEGLNVLIVDDNASTGDIIKTYLANWGFKGHYVPDGTSALQLLQQAAHQGKPLPVAIIDLVMPDIDGFKLARLIQQDPTLPDMRLILLTAFDIPGLAEQAFEAGFSAYVTKPINQARLHKALSQPEWNETWRYNFLVSY